MVVRIIGKALYRLFAESRWVANQFLEAFLHPLSVSYISTKTGKVTGRRPAFGKKAKEWMEANVQDELGNSPTASRVKQ